MILMSLTFCVNLALELLGTHNLEFQAVADDGDDAFAIDSNKVLSLDGDGDYIEIPHSPSLNITGNITLECWVKVTEITNEWDRLIVKTWPGDDDPWVEYGLVREAGTKKLGFQL